MAEVKTAKKSCSVNPLKMSAPLGGALAFMGIQDCMPLLHGSQGCTSLGLVLLVRHFKEAIPLQTTAMSEVSTVLGGYENVEQAILTIHKNTGARVIGICTTGVTETKGDDVKGFIRTFRTDHPELADVGLVSVATPDYKGGFQDGWEKAVAAMVEYLVEAPTEEIERDPLQVNVLPGCHLMPGDIEELREIFEDFGLKATFLPDLGQSLDGHIASEFHAATIGGVSLDEIHAMSKASWTIAIGEHMRRAAKAMSAKTGTPYRLFDRLTGLGATDDFLMFLSEISGKPVPVRYRRQRAQLCDAMMDAHFHLGGRRVAIGAEPDLLHAVGSTLMEMGCDLTAAVTTTTSPLLAQLPCEDVQIGDLGDLEELAEERDCDLLVTHSHGRQMAERLDIAFYRAGVPMFDRLGGALQVLVGYRGTRNLIFDTANLAIADHEAKYHPTPDTWTTGQSTGHAAEGLSPATPTTH